MLSLNVAVVLHVCSALRHREITVYCRLFFNLERAYKLQVASLFVALVSTKVLKKIKTPYFFFLKRYVVVVVIKAERSGF